MLAITDDAKELLKDVLEQRGESSQALRLSQTAQGLELTLDQAAEDDIIYDVGGRDVLVVQRDLASKMDGTTIQREESPDGSRLVISS
jgi:Fe-S cluster assembly iron-binding protein IscA